MDSEIKVYRDTLKKDISFWIYVKNRYENFHCSLIVENMNEDCVLLEKLRKLQESSTCCVRYVSSDLKRTEKYRSLNGTQRSFPVWALTLRQYQIRIGRFGSDRGYISTGIAEIYSSSITGSDIHYRMLANMVLLTFLLKCCVMTQQEGIMQDAYTFARTDQCQLPEYGPYSYICNLCTRIRAVHPSTCNVVRNAFGHLIRAPYYFQTLGWIGFIYGLIGMGPKFFSVPSPPRPMA